jgi:hypothetical protein
MTFDARIEHSLPRGKGGITLSGGHQHLDDGMMLTYQRASMGPPIGSSHRIVLGNEIPALPSSPGNRSAHKDCTGST